jgi:hypothetical protein
MFNQSSVRNHLRRDHDRQYAFSKDNETGKLRFTPKHHDFYNVDFKLSKFVMSVSYVLILFNSIDLVRV